MIKFKWKIEYSLTIFAIFAGLLFMIPTSFSSKNAVYISRWNSEYNKIEYMFTAMVTQAESDIVKNIKNSKNDSEREKYMSQLIKPYLRLKEPLKKRKYQQHYLNGRLISKKEPLYFDSLYNTEDGLIVGIKNATEKGQNLPVFLMMIDTNGYKKPNTWGKDIFGLNIYRDGNVNAIGYGWDIEKLRKDCSISGSGLSCSYFYRIGGEFIE